MKECVLASAGNEYVSGIALTLSLVLGIGSMAEMMSVKCRGKYAE